MRCHTRAVRLEPVRHYLAFGLPVAVKLVIDPFHITAAHDDRAANDNPGADDDELAEPHPDEQRLPGGWEERSGCG